MLLFLVIACTTKVKGRLGVLHPGILIIVYRGGVFETSGS